MQKFSKYLLISVIYSFLYNLPIIILRNSVTGNLNFKIILEFILSICISLLSFYLIQFLFRKRIGNSIIFILFIIGGLSTYAVINYGKFIDSGLIIDILTVDATQSSEFISLAMLVYVILSMFIAWVTLRVRKKPENDTSQKSLIYTTILLFWLSFAYTGFNVHTLKYMTKDYLPMSIFHNVSYFFYKYLPHFKKINNKNDLTKAHSFSFESKQDDPLIIVLVIGESMRGDILSINGYKGHDNTPLLNKVCNLVSFPNAKSSATSTRISIPYMLTSAVPPNFNKALTEKSIISIFKTLGFTTSWIGNQGAFGFYETTYASNILESDYHLIQDDLAKVFKLSKLDVYDEHILPILDNRLKEIKGNHFIVLHLYGSHWNFSKRYPASFGHEFLPICEVAHANQCPSESLKNLYHNTIVYSDYILNEVITKLKDKNAFMIYASDHGYSLGERNLFGNAYALPNVPKEQISISMFAWGSDRFMHDHPLQAHKILEKKSADINHDYIFHSLLDCTGVKSDYTDLSLSLCH